MNADEEEPTISYSDDEHGDYIAIDGLRLVEECSSDIGFTYEYTPERFKAIEAMFYLAADPATRKSATKWWRLTPTGIFAPVFRGFVSAHGRGSDGNDSVCTGRITKCHRRQQFGRLPPGELSARANP